MKKYLISASIALLLAGCAQTPKKIIGPSKSEQAPIDAASPEGPSSVPSEIGTAPSFPNIQSFNWAIPLEPLVEKMSQKNDLAYGSVLLLDTVKNNTNGLLQTENATASLQKILSSNPQFFLISANQLSKAKADLGISGEDKLSSRSKAIALARYLKAEYVLYAYVSGDIQSPILDMQLMLVRTGEIIWSDNAAILPQF